MSSLLFVRLPAGLSSSNVAGLAGLRSPAQQNHQSVPLFEFAFIPHIDGRLDQLAQLAEPEEVGYATREKVSLAR